MPFKYNSLLQYSEFFAGCTALPACLVAAVAAGENFMISYQNEGRADRMMMSELVTAACLAVTAQKVRSHAPKLIPPVIN
jgi:hypothetical protein